MNLTVIRSTVQKFASDNATGLLTTGGAVGVVATAVLTARASFKSAELIGEKKEFEAARLDLEKGKRENRVIEDFESTSPLEVKMTTTEKVKAVWPQFVVPVVVGGASIVSIVMANRLNAQRIAALAAAYSLSETRLKEYQAKVAEKLSGPKNQAVYDEVAQDRVNATPPSREVMILGGNDVLCFDQFTGRYFKSTMEDIKRAEISTNAEIFNHQYASLTYFYDELGLPPTTFSDEVGWNLATTNQMELRFSTVMSPDDKPCIAIDFTVLPQPNYHQTF